MLKSILFFSILVLIQLTLTIKAAGQIQVPDTATIGRLNRHGVKLLKSNPEAAKAEAYKALRLSRAGNYLSGQAAAARVIGTYYQNRQLHDSALIYFRHSHQAAIQAKDTTAEVLALVLQSLILQKTGHIKQALSLLLKQLAKSEAQNNPSLKAQLYRNIGDLYYEQHEYRTAASYDYQALRLLKGSKGREREYARTQFNLSKSLIQLDQFDSAQACLEAVLPIYKKQNSPDELAGVYNSLGSVMYSKKEFNKSQKFLLAAFSLYKQTNNLQSQVAVLSNLGSNYFLVGQLQQALVYYKQAFELARQSGNISLQQDVHGNLYWTYKDLGKTAQALYHYEKYNSIEDSLFSINRAKELAELRANYDIEKRDREIELLKKSRLLAQAQMDKRTTERNGLIGGLAITLLTGGLAFHFFSQRQRARTLLSAQQAEISQQRIRQLEQEQHINSIKASLEGQEQERARIGQDLHDRLGSMLSAVKLYFYLPAELRAQLQPKQLERMETANKLLDESCLEVRRIAHNMVSSVLNRFGLKMALEELCQTLNESNQIKIKLNCQNLHHRLDSRVEITVYRTIQELISNTLKHARADEISISLLNQQNKVLHLIYQDNGIGFNPEKAADGMGIQNLHARALQLGGSLEFDSAPGNGTVVTLDVPLPEALENAINPELTEFTKTLAEEVRFTAGQ